MKKILISVCLVMIASIALNIYFYQNSKTEKEKVENTRIVNSNPRVKTDTKNSRKLCFNALTEKELVQIVKSARELKAKSVDSYEKFLKPFKKRAAITLKEAEKGNVIAQFNMAFFYAKGIGVEKDEKQAVYWYQKAATLGHCSSQYHLSNYYWNGIGAPKDGKQAIIWCQKAAKQGHNTAQYNLGNCYHYGIGVEKDAKQAVHWYKKAAEQGNANAQTDLGYCYHYGIGVEKM